MPLVLGALVVVSLMTSEAVFSGAESASSPWFGSLLHVSGSRAEAREAELRALMEIRSEQEAAWLEYVLARRQYAKSVDDDRRQDLMSWAEGDRGLDTTFGGASPVRAAKSFLKTKFDALYSMLDEAQRARADQALSPAECGR